VRVRIEQAGGLAGVVQQLGTIDTELLPLDRASAVEQAVAELGREPAEIGADIPTYRVTVTDDGRERTYTCTEPEPGIRAAGLDTLLAELGT
jgi:hypothetical protein